MDSDDMDDAGGAYQKKESDDTKNTIDLTGGTKKEDDKTIDITGGAKRGTDNSNTIDITGGYKRSSDNNKNIFDLTGGVIGGDDEEENTTDSTANSKGKNKYLKAMTDMPEPLKKEGCGGCLNKFSIASCFVLTILGVPGFIIGILASIGVI